MIFIVLDRVNKIVMVYDAYHKALLTLPLLSK